VPAAAPPDAAPASDRLDQLKSSAHRPLGIVFVRLRPAEVGEHAVAQEPGQVSLEPTDHVGAGRLISPRDVAQVLRVEPRGEVGGADQVAEQHGQLATFGLERSRRHGDRLRGCQSPSLVERGDGVEQPAAVTDRCDAKRRQIVGRQPRQHFGVDMVGLECLDVIFQAQVAQLSRGVHLRRPG
jgi:hypothetical protein